MSFASFIRPRGRRRVWPVLVALTLTLSAVSGQIVPVNLGGTGSYDGWANINMANFPGYPGFSGSASWPAPIGSNTSGSGDAELQRVAGGSTGGPFPATDSLYFGSFTQVPNDLGGTVRVADATPVAGVKTIVLQVQIGEAVGYDFHEPTGQPVLRINGQPTAFASMQPVLIDHYQNGTYFSPETEQEEPVYVNTWGLQWDASQLGPVGSFHIEFSGVTHSQVYAIRLDQSTAVHTASVFGPVTAPSVVLRAVGTPQFDGTNTVVTHTFTSTPDTYLRLQFAAGLADTNSWTTQPADVYSGPGEFPVTFSQAGDQRALWQRGMFFRLTY